MLLASGPFARMELANHTQVTNFFDRCVLFRVDIDLTNVMVLKAILAPYVASGGSGRNSNQDKVASDVSGPL